jgi:hypothetical protein
MLRRAQAHGRVLTKDFIPKCRHLFLGAFYIYFL